jgi:hydrogenase maturation factor
MMDGTLVFTGRVLSLRQEPHGRCGRVSVRGAQVEVALDLVPEAVVGDAVLVHAGVALSLVRDAEEGSRGDGTAEARSAAAGVDGTAEARSAGAGVDGQEA